MQIQDFKNLRHCVSKIVIKYKIMNYYCSSCLEFSFKSKLNNYWPIVQTSLTKSRLFECIFTSNMPDEVYIKNKPTLLLAN